VLLAPEQIVTEYNGRSEHEVIPDLDRMADNLFFDAEGGCRIIVILNVSRD
jgi:hypothetical protein